jgi:membrane-associated phospholipid phosphatase
MVILVFPSVNFRLNLSLGRKNVFQTDLIVWLQSFAHPILTSVMQALSFIGYPLFYILFIFVFFFGINHQKGWEILHLVLFGALLTFLAKEFFAYPRPFYLDDSLKLWDPFLLKKTFPLVEGYKASSFFSLIPDNILNEFRKIPNAKFGFPSGHTSLSLCFWGYLWQSYRQNKTISLLCLFMIFFIPFSRAYLGVHFIGDILGGYLLGSFVLWAFHKKIKTWIFLFKPPFSLGSWSYFFLFPLASLFFLSRHNLFVGCYLLGINLTLFFIKDFEVLKKLEQKKVMERLFMVLGTIAVFFLMRVILKKGLLIMGLGDNIVALCIRHTLTPLIGLTVPLFFLKRRFDA